MNGRTRDARGSRNDDSNAPQTIVVTAEMRKIASVDKARHRLEKDEDDVPREDRVGERTVEEADGDFAHLWEYHSSDIGKLCH